MVLPIAGLLTLTVLHDLDHVRQGRALDLELWGVGTLALVGTSLVLILAIRESVVASAVGFVVGLATVVGVIAVHVAPMWWFLSDSYGEAGVDTVSWAVIIAMMLAGAWLSWTAASCWNLSAPKTGSATSANTGKRKRF